MKKTNGKASLRVGRTRRLALYGISVGVWLSGGLWLLFHYFLMKKGQFGMEPNALEPWWLKLHGAFAFATIWVFGLYWGIHVKVAWPYKKRRWSGGTTVAVFFLLALTGYLLYYTGNDEWRSIISVLHWVVGLLSPLALVWHRLRHRRKRIQSRSTGDVDDRVTSAQVHQSEA